MLHVFAERFATSFAKFANMACVRILESTVICLPRLLVLVIFISHFFLSLLRSPFHAFSLGTKSAQRFHHIAIEFVYFPRPLFRSLTTLEFCTLRKYSGPEATSLCYLLVLLLLSELLLRLGLLDLFETTVVQLNVLV